MLLLEELKERLATVDEVTLLEVLEIDAESLVEVYEDRIIDNYDKLVGILDD
jgi:hypothetical protein